MIAMPTTDVLEEVEGPRGVARIYVDEAPENPRNWDNLGTIIAFARGYDIADPVDKWPAAWTLADINEAAWALVERGATSVGLVDALVELLRRVYGAGRFVWLPLYLLDHSGLLLTTDRRVCEASDPHGWDWGEVGVIYAPRDRILAEYGRKRLTRQLRGHVERVLASEVEVFSCYLNGEVYVVEDDEEGPVGGFYGWDEAMREARRRVGLEDE